MKKRKHFPSLGCLFFKHMFKAQQFVCPFHSNQSMGSAFKVWDHCRALRSIVAQQSWQTLNMLCNCFI
ncbi:unnamed protein product [Lactuca virosa]|uniref:Uncharacterized protein n=1 Tax=Lactuca virosa TaxID=75947 RepID=A0AAU9LZY4_9ASTR|nr:unnamed protein product [Lactuca virosa]